MASSLSFAQVSSSVASLPQRTTAAVVCYYPTPAYQACESRSRRATRGVEVVRARRRVGAGATPPLVAGAQVAETQPGDQYFTAKDQRPVILFDGVCNL